MTRVPDLARFNPAQPGTAGMKLAATGLLVAMVAGMVPVALSLTGDSSFRGPMGITVIGGLVFSTVLTLLIVPASFSIAVDVESWFVRKFGKMIDNGEPHRPMAEPLPAE